MKAVDLRDYQLRTLAALYQAIRKGFKRNIVVVPGGGGKLQPYHEPVLTPDGWVVMKDIKEGDFIICPVSGDKVKVIGTIDHKGLDIYKVSFKDGTYTECCDDHLWKCYERRLRKEIIAPISYIRNRLKEGDSYNFSVQNTNPVNFSKKNYSIEPYTLGYLLGNGCLRIKGSTMVSFHEDDSNEVIGYLDKSYKVSKHKTFGNAARAGIKTSIKPRLNEIGLLGKKSIDKFIPSIYKLGSVKQRIELLRGLMDSDGSIEDRTSKMKIRYSTVSKSLRDDVLELVKSLGGTASYSKDNRKANCCYKISIRININPFKLTRKASIYDKHKFTFKFVNKIVGVEYIGKKDGRCLVVGSEHQLYITRGYNVTHNSTIFAKFCQVCVLKGKRVVFVVHSKELVEQFHLRLYNQFGVDSGIIMSGVKPKRWLPIQVCSVQTLVRRDFPEADVLIIDECHRTTSKTYKKIVANYSNKIIVGLTATPFRGDGKGLGDIYENIVHAVRCAELIEKGFLVGTKVFASKKKVDLKGVKTRLGEYDQKELYERYNSTGLYKEVVRNYEENAKGTKAIVFSINVQHSKNTCQAFIDAGYKACHLDSDTPKALRTEIIKKYRKGRYDILLNCSLFTEGFDVPFIETVILNRAIKSLPLYLQSVMRGMRPLIGEDGLEMKNEDGTVKKTKCIVLDHGANTIRHGLVENYDHEVFTLSDGAKRGGGEAPTKECRKCNHVCFAAATVCSECGAEFRKKKVDYGKSGEYSTELLEPDVIFIENLKALPWSKVKKLPIWKVRAYEAIKGYKSGWYQFMVKDMKPNLKKASWTTILNMCIEAEKQMNTHEVTAKLIKLRKNKKDAGVKPQAAQKHKKFGW